MSNLIPNPSWDDVTQLELNTRAIGGMGGIMNAQAQALLNRSEYLQQEIITLQAQEGALILVTDPAFAGGAKLDGSDDTAAFQAAINASAGRPLYVPKGSGIVSSLTIPHSMEFYGDGLDSVIKQKNGANQNLFTVTAPGVKVVFRSLTIDGNNGQQTYGNGKFSFYSNAQAGGIAEFHRVRFKDSNTGAIIFIGDRNDDTREILRLRDCEFRGGTESQSSVHDTFTVLVQNGAEIDVDGCDFDHGLTLNKQGIPAITVQASITSSEKYCRVRVVNSDFKGYGRFTVGTGIGPVDMYIWGAEVIVSGNRFTGSRTTAIRGKTNCKNVVINGNVVADNISNGDDANIDNGGIALARDTYDPTASAFVITANIIRNVFTRGIYISGGGASGSTLAYDLLMDGNIVSGVTGGTAYGIFINTFSRFNLGPNEIHNTAGIALVIASCQGQGTLNGVIINTAGAQGIFANNQTSLDLTVTGCQIEASTISGMTLENLRHLTLTGNRVKDVVDGGASGQRGYRIGGTSGIASGVVANNSAIGTFAQGAFSLNNAGIIARHEYGNTWNRQESWGSAAPTTGNWNRNDVVWNTLASAGGNVGWVCTASGTPGTWKTFGTIAA